MPSQCVEVSDWIICLSSEGATSEKANRVLVSGNRSTDGVSGIVTAADFDSDFPLFCCSDGRKFKLLGSGEARPRGDLATTFSSDSTLSDLLVSATSDMSSNWCSATLHHLLCLLDTRFHPNATLSINERNVLVATSDNDCLELLPFYILLGKLGTSNIMRLYTCRGVGTRIIVPDPCPVLTNWCFVPLPIGTKKVGLGFCAWGKFPDSDLESGSCLTTAITGIDSEGVVSTVNGTPYRLEGPCHLDVIKGVPVNHPFRQAMATISKESGPMYSVMQALSRSFQETPSYFDLPIIGKEAATNAAASPERPAQTRKNRQLGKGAATNAASSKQDSRARNGARR